MSVVILGGNECMERQYTNACRKYGCKAKVFCKPCADMSSRIGSPDLLIVFTHTISHKMLKCALTGIHGTDRNSREHEDRTVAYQFHEVSQGYLKRARMCRVCVKQRNYFAYAEYKLYGRF